MAAHALTQHQDNDAALSLPFYIEPTILSSWTGDWSERSVLFHMTTHPQHNDPNKPFYSLSLFKMFSCWNNKSVFQGSFEQRHKNVCFQAATVVSEEHLRMRKSWLTWAKSIQSEEVTDDNDDYEKLLT